MKKDCRIIHIICLWYAYIYIDYLWENIQAIPGEGLSDWNADVGRQVPFHYISLCSLWKLYDGKYDLTNKKGSNMCLKIGECLCWVESCLSVGSGLLTQTLSLESLPLCYKSLLSYLDTLSLHFPGPAPPEAQTVCFTRGPSSSSSPSLDSLRSQGFLERTLSEIRLCSSHNVVGQ